MEEKLRNPTHWISATQNEGKWQKQTDKYDDKLFFFPPSLGLHNIVKTVSPE